MTPGHRSPSPLVRVALIAVVAVIAGVVVGHFVWRRATAAVRLAPASHRIFGSFRPDGSGATGEGGGGRSGGLFGPAAGAGEGAGSVEGAGSGEGEAGSGEGEAAGSGGSAGSGAGVSGAVTAKVDPALVDIDTDLGLQGGEAAGTGMVVTSGGEVITNNHVIDGATKITATDVGNGVTYTARVVGYDHSQDIAVLQLEGASGLKTVAFAGASPAVGESVATIGNAGGAGGTPSATAGRVAALEQSITAGDEIDSSQEHLGGLIQIDGDLQPGDSGGPLVDERGEVLGMDTAASSTFQFQSSADEGFAIPVEHVLAIARQILRGESSSTVHIGATGLLGVFVQGRSGEVQGQSAEVQGRSGEGEGAVVENVIAGAPAASSGLAAGDTITAVDGTRVGTPTALTEVILQKHPGETLAITWQTPAGAQQTANVTLAGGPPQ